jgi:hypothetical protein
MKLSKYNNFFENNDWDEEEDFFNRWNSGDKSKRSSEEDDWESYNRWGLGDYSEDDYDEDEKDIEDDDMGNLLYLLRSMFKNSGIDEVYIENKKMDITISVELRKRERLKDIIKVFEVANKLKRDILAQYDSEFEMWETKEGRPLLVFNFMYDEGLYDDEAPF